MEKLIPIVLFISLLLIGNVLMYFIVKAYYRNNNIRFPYEKWYLRYKKDVTIREKLILSAIQQVPLIILMILFFGINNKFI